MPMKPQKQKTSERVSLISAVKTYLGFFVLVLLVVEGALGILALKATGNIQLVAVYGMLFIIVALISIVSFFAYRKPDALLRSVADLGKETIKGDISSVDNLASEPKKKEIATGSKVPSEQVLHADSAFYTERAKYYDRYYYLVANAKRKVVMIGDGFTCHDDSNKGYATGLINSIRAALKNGIPVKRFQYHRTLSLAWLKMLCDLKEDFGDLFQVYMHKEFDPTALPYVICLVDHNTKQASLNVMFTRSSDTSLEEKLAGPAFIFEHGNEKAMLMDLMHLSISDFFQKEYNMSSNDLLKFMSSLKNERSKKVRSYYQDQNMIDVTETSIRRVAKELNMLDVDFVKEIAIREISSRGELYFAYGSNVDRDRLRKRCQSARFISCGSLEDYKVVFNMMGNKDEGKGGGIANIIKSVGSSVYGVLYGIEKSELELLNELENSMNYKVVELSINITNYGEIPAIVYIGDQNNEEQYKPTKEYSQFIKTGMKTYNFPDDYQHQILKAIDK